jgi:hypothetical protein
MLMLAYDPSTNPLNNNDWAFPLLEIIHIAGFTLSIGTIALVDLRMLGLAMLRQPSSQVAKDMAPWTLIGLAIMLTEVDPIGWTKNRPFLDGAAG